MQQASPPPAPEPRRDALAGRVCEARLYSDTWLPLTSISTGIQAIVFRVWTDRRHLMFQRVCRASTLRKPAAH
jgi:hypothetical protein